MNLKIPVISKAEKETMVFKKEEEVLVEKKEPLKNKTILKKIIEPKLKEESEEDEDEDDIKNDTKLGKPVKETRLKQIALEASLSSEERINLVNHHLKNLEKLLINKKYKGYSLYYLENIDCLNRLLVQIGHASLDSSRVLNRLNQYFMNNGISQFCV